MKVRRYHAAVVLPISEPPIINGTVGVLDGRIIFVGERHAGPIDENVELGDVVLMPGLVNTHTHLELTVMRGLLEGLDFQGWIRTLQRAKVTVLASRPGALLDSARLGLEEGLRAGITCYADTCDSGVALQAMSEAGVRGIMYQEVFGPDPASCHAAISDLEKKLASLSERTDELRQVGISPHAPYTVSDLLYANVAQLADEMDLPIAVHIAESRAEVDLVTRGEGPFVDGLRGRGLSVEPRAPSPIELLERTGVLGPRTLCIHAVHANERDIDLISDRDASVAHCPISNARLGNGSAPLAEFLAAGVKVGLGSDSMASNDRMHMLEEARAAALIDRLRRPGEPALSPAEYLELVTLGGAEALGLESEIGTLERGKYADLAAFPLGTALGGAICNPEAAALYSLGGAAASFVTVRGEPLVEGGRLLRRDPELGSRAAELASALAQWRRDEGRTSY